MAMLELYRRCETFRLRPSDELGIRAPWVAWQFNRAVHVFGATVMARYHERDEDGQRIARSLEECMGLPAPVKPVSLAALRARGGARVKA